MVSSAVNIVLRGVQALFGIVVLGLSATLLNGHHWGDTPAGLGYGVFVGVFSFLGALIGLAATWFNSLGGMIGLALDIVVALVNLAGGIVYVIKLDGVKCEVAWNDATSPNRNNARKLAGNDWFNGGCQKVGRGGIGEACWVEYRYPIREIAEVIIGHCKEATADFIFMFLTAGVVIVCALLVWMRMRRGY